MAIVLFYPEIRNRQTIRISIHEDAPDSNVIHRDRALAQDLIGATIDELCAALWLGALWPLLMTVRRLPALQAAAVLEAFSRYALVVVATLVVAGTVLAFLQLNAPSDLFHTPYGQRLGLKLIAVCGLFRPHAKAPHRRAGAGLQRTTCDPHGRSGAGCHCRQPHGVAQPRSAATGVRLTC